MRKLVLFVSVIACVLLWPPRVEAQTQAPPTNTAEQETFLHEFDDVCSRTQDSMLLTKEQLKDLMRRCDALVTKLPKLDETRRKVYARRLEQCRGLFAYVLDSKKNSND
ncbi:MAG TPA: hypothetical protein VMT82_11400 [candidate division Zixibacteria bacterium]|nr:hypothetical protein [candidate division Zixibacteria bacterium]